MIAGPPCQGFSTAGKRDIDDPRNHLLISAAQIAINMSPKVFVLENVPGVVLGRHRRYWQKLREIFISNKYQTTDFVIDSQNIGLAQTRKRLFFLAWRTWRGWEPSDISEQKLVLRDVLSDMASIPNHNITYLEPSSSCYKIVENIEPGQKLSNVRGGARSVHTWDIPDVYGETTIEEQSVLESIQRLRRRLRMRDSGDADPVLKSAISKDVGFDCTLSIRNLQAKGYVRKIGNKYDLCRSFNGKYRRLSWEEPSYTVDTRFTDHRYFLHPSEHRGFTVREAARIQGFPDSFIFMGKEREQAKQVGNAVPPPLAKWIAHGVQRMLDDEGSEL